MSRITLKGDTTNTFGRFLPTPRIQKVEIYDDASFLVEYAIFLPVETDEELAQMLVHLEENVSICMSETRAFKNRFFDELVNSNAPEEVFTPIREALLGDSWKPVTEGGSDEDYWTGFFKTPYNFVIPEVFVDANIDTETIYDKEGKRFAKITMSYIRPTPDPEIVSTWDDISWYEDGGFDAIMLYSMDRNFIETVADISSTYHMMTLLRQNPLLVRSMMSDIDYEVLLIGKEVPNRTQMIYVNSDGGQYTELPLQSVTNQYFEQDTYTYDDIYEDFKSLIDDYDYTTADEELKNGLDQMTYVIESYKDKVDLIPELNALRKAWPNRNLGERIGHLYERFRRRLVNANSSVIEQPLLHKELVVGTKVVDQRGHTFDAWEDRWSDDSSAGDLSPGLLKAAYWDYYRPGGGSGGSDFSGAGWRGTLLYPTFRISNYAFTSGEAMSTVSDYVMANGYYWFDYDKFVYTQCQLSRFYSPTKVINYFGKEVMNMHVRIAGSTIYRTPQPWLRAYGTTGGDDIFVGNHAFRGIKIEADNEMWQFENPETTDALASPLTVKNSYYDSAIYTNGDGFGATGDEASPTPESDGWGTREIAAKRGGTLKSYNYLRNFSLVGPIEDATADIETLQNYRMACFEFQDLFPKELLRGEGSQRPMGGSMYSTPPHAMYYSATVKMRDSSLALVKAITGSYLRTQAELSEYVIDASTYCSYNDIDNRFNQFFVDYIEGLYGEAESPPYVKAATQYHLHRDLLYNESYGDLGTVMYKAKVTADAIGPHGGTLPALMKFSDDYKELYEQNYKGMENNALAEDTSGFSDIEGDFAVWVGLSTYGNLNAHFRDSGMDGDHSVSLHFQRYGYCDLPPPDSRDLPVEGNWIQPCWETDYEMILPDWEMEQIEVQPGHNPKPFSIIECDGWGNIIREEVNMHGFEELIAMCSYWKNIPGVIIQNFWQEAHKHATWAADSEFSDAHGGFVARGIVHDFLSTLGGTTSVLMDHDPQYTNDWTNASNWWRDAGSGHARAASSDEFAHTAISWQSELNQLFLGAILYGVCGLKMGAAGSTQAAEYWHDWGQSGYKSISSNLQDMLNNKATFLRQVKDGGWVPSPGFDASAYDESQAFRSAGTYTDFDGWIPGSEYWAAICSLACTFGANTSKTYADEHRYMAFMCALSNCGDGRYVGNEYEQYGGYVTDMSRGHMQAAAPILGLWDTGTGILPSIKEWLDAGDVYGAGWDKLQEWQDNWIAENGTEAGGDLLEI